MVPDECNAFHTINLHHSDSIIERYQYSMSEDRAFESLLLENYSSFILTIECKRRELLSVKRSSRFKGHNQGKIAMKQQQNILFSSMSFPAEFHFQ